MTQPWGASPGSGAGLKYSILKEMQPGLDLSNLLISHKVERGRCKIVASSHGADAVVYSFNPEIGDPKLGPESNGVATAWVDFGRLSLKSCRLILKDYETQPNSSMMRWVKATLTDRLTMLGYNLNTMVLNVEIEETDQAIADALYDLDNIDDLDDESGLLTLSDMKDILGEIVQTEDDLDYVDDINVTLFEEDLLQLHDFLGSGLEPVMRLSRRVAASHPVFDNLVDYFLQTVQQDMMVASLRSTYRVVTANPEFQKFLHILGNDEKPERRAKAPIGQEDDSDDFNYDY